MLIALLFVVFTHNASAEDVIQPYDFKCMVNVYAGWNLIGSTHTGSVGDMVNASTVQIVSLWRYDGKNKRYDVFLPGSVDRGQSQLAQMGLGFFRNLRVNEGFWVEATTDGQINICPGKTFDAPPGPEK